MERPPSPGQHPEQKEPQETPNFEDMEDSNSNSPVPMEDLSQILLHADAARAESTPLHKTQRGSAAGTQATEEKETTPVNSVTSTSPPSTNPFDATQGSAPATAPATPAVAQHDVLQGVKGARRITDTVGSQEWVCKEMKEVVPKL